MEKRYFGYIRVSTVKQGEKGVSLQEQRSTIETYARRFELRLAEWFEERESAARRGRPVFTQMMRQLQRGKAQGVIIHKIDRGARNLKDWADLGELIDSGVEVHFANESLDLNTRGGRLSADIQAVVAADYIRNLREETRKGFYGRLKQGLYPLPAPLGYLDAGKGKIKNIDPLTAPFIRKAFELYSMQRYSLHSLLAELNGMGLRNSQGKPITLNGISTILNNPFYMGIIRVKTTSELFLGAHQPLVSKSLFDRVQMILEGKTVDRVVRHDFTFRRMVRCASCKRSLIGELQKSHVYYRCQTKHCPTTTVREEVIDSAIAAMLSALELDDEELGLVANWMAEARAHQDTTREEEIQGARLKIDGIRNRLQRLVDAFIDGVLDKALFEDRKSALTVEEAEARDRIRYLEAGADHALKQLEEFLELIKDAPFTYKHATPQEKRELLRNLFSNMRLIDRNVDVEPNPGVQVLVNRPKLAYSSPSRDATRTWDRILKKLLKQFGGSDHEARPGETPVKVMKAAA
jgi:site-specific DNA recombinase